jgi:hypothetical protein
MAKCDYCGSTVIFGGKREGELRFCNDRCRARGQMLSLSGQLPESSVQQSLWSVHQGNCPKCQGPGPVDVHVSHWVWSALLLTRWSSTPQISCRLCGTRSQLAGAGFSLALGWWGVPWGFIVTPIQVGPEHFRHDERARSCQPVGATRKGNPPQHCSEVECCSLRQTERRSYESAGINRAGSSG